MALMKIKFVTNTDKVHDIYFDMFNNDLVRRWIEMTLKCQKDTSKKLHHTFFNKTIESVDQVRDKLSQCINRINMIYDIPINDFSDFKLLTFDQLNFLHQQYEIYGDRTDALIRNGTNWSSTMHSDFLLLNELIHQYEDCLSSKSNPVANMAVLYDYYPQGLHAPLRDSDKLWFKTNLDWGGVYLGYNTLGKDWWNVFKDNDIEVIDREQVRPQERFAAETWINFGPDMGEWWSLHKFNEWYENLPTNLKKKVPMNNIGNLSLGRIKIGQVITEGSNKEGYFHKYADDESHWSVFNHPIKNKWNEEVFSTFSHIEEITFSRIGHWNFDNI